MFIVTYSKNQQDVSALLCLGLLFLYVFTCKTQERKEYLTMSLHGRVLLLAPPYTSFRLSDDGQH